MPVGSPAQQSAERDRAWKYGNNLDRIASKFGLGNRDDFIDHGEVKLACPG